MEAAFSPQSESDLVCGMKIETSDPASPVKTVPMVAAGTWETEQTDYFIQSENSGLQHFLSATAKSPAIMMVWVDQGNGYTQCLDGWSYDEDSNSIIFHGNYPDSYCYTPPTGAVIKVWYKMDCSAEGPVIPQLPQPNISPTFINFGLTTLGCFSNMKEICIKAPEEMPVTVTDITTLGCSNEFYTYNLPTLPNTIQAGGELCFDTNYYAMNEGNSSCEIHVNVAEEPYLDLEVALAGAGTEEAWQDYEFIQSISMGFSHQLPHQAAPASVSVMVNGENCTTGWQYDPVSNSVIFDGEDYLDPCNTPKPADIITIHYALPCLSN